MPVRYLESVASAIVLILVCLSTLACNKDEPKPKPKSKPTSESQAAPAPQKSVQPEQSTPKLTPEEVVKSQLEAFRASGGTTNGLAAAYDFSSPAHKQKMPVLMHSAKYGALLNFESAEFGTSKIQDSDAQQIVMLHDGRGQVQYFLFRLRIQTSGPDQGHWRTEAIHPGVLDINVPISDSKESVPVDRTNPMSST